MTLVPSGLSVNPETEKLWIGSHRPRVIPQGVARQSFRASEGLNVVAVVCHRTASVSLLEVSSSFRS